MVVVICAFLISKIAHDKIMSQKMSRLLLEAAPAHETRKA